MIETVLITTTINVPTFLDKILKNIFKNKKNNKLVCLVIGDKKTPTNARSYCRKLEKKYKTTLKYFDIKDQDKYFKTFKDLYKMFPYNDAVRKLLGSIYAWENYKSYLERIIFIDDDNYLTNKKDFLSGHEKTGSVINGISIASRNQWLNIYEKINVENNIPIFPRGYPWKYRGIKNTTKIKKFKKKKVIAKCGFIIGDPDIDAVSRLFWPINVKNIKSNNDFYFSPGTYTPFNDQNTSIHRDYVLLYYKPLSAGRNSDIWTSYLICKMAEIYDEIVSYGSPHLKQIRNKHDYWKDYNLEVEHNISTDYFVDLLKKVKIKKQKNKFLTLKKICENIILEISKSLKKIKIENTNDRHYQGFSKTEKNIRTIQSLNYIKLYFKEYILWLRNVEKLYK